MDGFGAHVRDMRLVNPSILPVPEEGLYYLYHAPEPAAEEGESAVYARTSPDLIHWSEPITALAAAGEFRGTPEIRSPRVYRARQGCLMLASVRYESTVWSCQCFRAAVPAGPFRPVGGPLTSPEDSSADGALMKDARGRPWLVFCRQRHDAGDEEICAVPLAEGYTAVYAGEVVLFSAAETAWGQASLSEDGRHFRRSARSPWPYAAADGSLIMLWTGDSRVGSAVGAARSASGDVVGPWAQMEEPLYGMDGGGASVFTDFAGRPVMALHSPDNGGDARMLLFEMEEREGGLHIVNEITGNWYPIAYREDGTMKRAAP